MKNSAIAFSALSILWAPGARASIEPIFTPIHPMAIIIMQGYGPDMNLPDDPEVRQFYDTIAQPPMDAPNGDPGKGKVISTSDNSFVLSCAERGQFKDNVDCTFTIQSTDHSHLDALAQTADATITGKDAEALYTFFAGSGATQTYEWRSPNGWVDVQSAPEEFHFRFTTHPTFSY